MVVSAPHTPRQQEAPDLLQWLCSDSLKLCCPSGTFGPSCLREWTSIMMGGRTLPGPPLQLSLQEGSLSLHRLWQQSYCPCPPDPMPGSGPMGNTTPLPQDLWRKLSHSLHVSQCKRVWLSQCP